jgi:hypothetical protein
VPGALTFFFLVFYDSSSLRLWGGWTSEEGAAEGGGVGRGCHGLGVRGSLQDVLLWIGDPCRHTETQAHTHVHRHTPDFKDAPGVRRVDEWVGEGAGKGGGNGGTVRPCTLSRYRDGQSKKNTKTAGERLLVVDGSSGPGVRDDFVLESERERERREKETPSTRCHSTPPDIMGSQEEGGGGRGGAGEGSPRDTKGKKRIMHRDPLLSSVGSRAATGR